MNTTATVNQIMNDMIKPVSNDFHSCPVDVKRQILSIDFDIKQCEINHDLGDEYAALKVVRDALIALMKVFPSK